MCVCVCVCVCVLPSLLFRYHKLGLHIMYRSDGTYSYK